MSTGEKLYDSALDFAEKQEYEKAYALYNAAAQLDYVPAQINVAIAYLKGQGVAQNDQAAFMWLQKAAAQNHPVALSNLGFCYSQGRGVAVDKQRALALYKQAADMGNEMGSKNYKALYEDLYGVPPTPPAPPAPAQPQYQQPQYQQPQYQQPQYQQPQYQQPQYQQPQYQPAPPSAPVSNIYTAQDVQRILNMYKESWVPKLCARLNGFFIAFLILFAFRGFEGYPELFLSLFGSFILICTLLTIFFSFPHRKRYYKRKRINEAIRYDSGDMQIAIKVYNAYPGKKSLDYIRALNPAAAQLIDYQLAQKKAGNS